MTLANPDPDPPKPPPHMVPLRTFGIARSGDKGNHANVGIVALSDADFEHLRRHLTAEKVRDFFEPTGVTKVTRFELPNIWALNFVLENALGGGASLALRIDTQGKLLGTAIERLSLPERTISHPTGP